MKDSDQKYFLNERLWSKYFSMWDSDQKYFNNLLPCCRCHQLLSRQRREKRRETTLERFLQLLNLCTKDQTKTRPRSRSRPPLKECQNFGLFARKKIRKRKRKEEKGGHLGKIFATFESSHKSENTSLQRTRASELCCSPTSVSLDQWKIFVGLISRKK